MYKRLEGGGFQCPRSKEEARDITWQKIQVNHGRDFYRSTQDTKKVSEQDV